MVSRLKRIQSLPLPKTDCQCCGYWLALSSWSVKSLLIPEIWSYVSVALLPSADAVFCVILLILMSHTSLVNTDVSGWLSEQRWRIRSSWSITCWIRWMRWSSVVGWPSPSSKSLTTWRWGGSESPSVTASHTHTHVHRSVAQANATALASCLARCWTSQFKQLGNCFVL